MESVDRSGTEAVGFQLLEDSHPAGEPIRYRSEIKFLLPYADLGKIRSVLEINCRRVRYAGPVSLVNSIYFDDSSLSAYRESVDGTGRRSKVRLRWYDSNDTNGRFHFEVKRRADLSVGKERLSLSSPTLWAS